jgi:hypothetical protein
VLTDVETAAPAPPQGDDDQASNDDNGECQGAQPSNAQGAPGQSGGDHGHGNGNSNGNGGGNGDGNGNGNGNGQDKGKGKGR